MAHIGADCIACIALRCVALHLQLQVQLGMAGMLSLLILAWFGFIGFGIAFCFSGFGYDGRVVCGNVGYAFAMCVDI